MPARRNHVLSSITPHALLTTKLCWECGTPYPQNDMREDTLEPGLVVWKCSVCQKSERKAGMATMTHAEHDAMSANYEANLAAKRAAVKTLSTLAEKVAAKQEIKQIEEAFRQHRLNYFELTRA